MTSVAIIGTHSADWMAALGPAAPVWSLLPDVEHVSLGLPDRPVADIVAIPLLESHTAAIPAGVRALVPHAQALGTLADKARFRDFLEAHAFAGLAPRHLAVDSPEFPCMVKRTDLNCGRGNAVASSAEELAAVLDRAPWRGHEVVIQELVVDFDEYVCHAVAVEGAVTECVTYHYLTSEPPDPVMGHHARTADTPQLARAALERILAALSFSGPCCMNFGTTADGRGVVFEINPRLGGSLMRSGNVNDLAVILSAVIRSATPHHRAQAV